jgi:natural product precursor
MKEFIKIFNYFCSMKKISLKRVSKTMSDKELKNVLGGSSGDSGATPEPCPSPHIPCNGPPGAYAGGGICCLIPCNGIFRTYGFAVLMGVNACPW